MPLDAAITPCVATPQPAANHPRCGSRSATRWGVVHTHPQAEHWAALNLRRQGFDAYLPLRTVIRRDPATRTISRLVDVPLFTSYLFVAVVSPWTPITHTLGVNRLMMDGPNPYILDAGAWSRLQAVAGAGRTHPSGVGVSWRPGDAVAPRTGPLGGMPGVVLAADADEAVVGILFLGQLREVRYPNEALVIRQDY